MNIDLVKRAASAVFQSCTPDDMAIENGKELVDAWAVDALGFAVSPLDEHDTLAEQLLAKYSGKPWSRAAGLPGPYRSGYIGVDPEDDEGRCDWCSDFYDGESYFGLCGNCDAIRTAPRKEAALNETP